MGVGSMRGVRPRARLGAGGGGATLGLAIVVHAIAVSPVWAEPALDEPIVTHPRIPTLIDTAWAALPASAVAAPIADQTRQTGAVVLTPIQGPLLLEDRRLGDISGEVAADGSGVIDAARLIDLLDGVVAPDLLEVVRARTAGRDRIGLADLAPDGLTVRFDTFALAFVLELSPTLRARRQVSFGSREIIDPASFRAPSTLSAAANIAFGQTYDHRQDEFRGLRAASDILINVGGFEGVTLTGGFDYDEDADEKFRRDEIRLTKDDFDAAVRYSLGEFSPPIQGFQGSNRILGVSAARAYSVIRPFQNVRPSGRREFILDRASFVEVEVNGVVVERLRLEAGPYSLSDFPFGQGANTVRFLIEDGVGRREIAVFDLYGGAALLDPGITDFGVAAGVTEGGGEYEYDGDLALSGFVRRGLTDALTLGGGGQWVGERVMLEASTTWGSRIGLLDLGIAGSHNADTGDSGWAVSVDYLHQVSAFERDDTRLVATFEAYSEDFQSAFDQFASNPIAWRAAAQVSSRWRAYTMNAGVARVRGRLGPDETSYDLTVGRSFGSVGISLSLGRRELEGRKADNRIGLALSVTLGGRWSGQARYDSDQDFRELALRRSSSGGLDDLSGGLRLSRDSGREAIGGDLRYVNNRFDAEVISNRLASREPGGPTSSESQWRVSTLLAYADGMVGLGRPAREGFIMARRHESLRGARLALTDFSGREIAREGWFGPALVPIDRAYSVQRLELSVEPLPPGYNLGDGVITAFPGFGSGYGFTVGSDASRTALGVILGADGQPLALISGELRRTGDPEGAEPKQFFTNRAGRFVGDGLSPGDYVMIVGGREVGRFTIAEDSEGVVDVGVIRP